MTEPAEEGAVERTAPARGASAWAIPLVAVLAGVGVVLVGWRGLSAWSDATRAVAVEAEVLRAEVHDGPVERAAAGDAVYLPYLEYSWRAAGVGAVDNNAETQPPLADPAEAERIVAAHPVGSKITVYYDPDEPFRATPEAPSGAGVLAATLGAIAGVIAVAVLLGIAIARRARSD